jgi:predicted nucleic acid-binding protein
MNNFVLDASVTISWCFDDEKTPSSIALLDKLETSRAFVPSLWPLEIGNVLISAELRKKITYAQISQFISFLNGVNIQIDNETANKGLHEIITLAHSEHLTTYDAAYLELAMRLGLPLATKDSYLKKAAKKLGVVLINI